MLLYYFPKELTGIIDSYIQPEKNIYTNKDYQIAAYTKFANDANIPKNQREFTYEIINTRSYTVVYMAVYNDIGNIRDFQIHKNDQKQTLIMTCCKGEVTYTVNPLLGREVMDMLDEYTRQNTKLLKLGIMTVSSIPSEDIWYNIMATIMTRIGHINY